MKTAFKKVLELLEDPLFLRRFHGWSALGWFVAAFPICIFLNQSIAFVVFISVYAIVLGHWSSWQAARIEVKEDEREGS